MIQDYANIDLKKVARIMSKDLSELKALVEEVSNEMDTL